MNQAFQPRQSWLSHKSIQIYPRDHGKAASKAVIVVPVISSAAHLLFSEVLFKLPTAQNDDSPGTRGRDKLRDGRKDA